MASWFVFSLFVWFIHILLRELLLCLFLFVKIFLNLSVNQTVFVLLGR